MKKDAKILKLIAAIIAMICLLLAATAASAVEATVSNESASVLDYLTDKAGKYTGPSVEDNVARMDTDKNGFADVFEVRAFLQLKHGNDYQKEMLDHWEASAYGKSCSSPFAKALYSDKSY